MEAVLQNNIPKIKTDTYTTLRVVRDEKETPNPESILWERFKDGDEEAFLEIYNRYVRLLFNYGMKFSSDRELTQDCIQDFFLYLRERRERLGTTTSIKFYLLRSFRRRLFVYLNKVAQENKRNVDTNEFHAELIDCNVEKMINAEAKSDLIKKLNRVMNELVEKEREAIFLYYYQKLSYQEIAEVLRFTHVSSARRLIYTALDNMKLKLKKFH